MLILSLHLHRVLLSCELRATQPAAKGCTTWTVSNASNLQLFKEYLTFIPFVCNSSATCHGLVDFDQHPLVTTEQEVPSSLENSSAKKRTGRTLSTPFLRMSSGPTLHDLTDFDDDQRIFRFWCIHSQRSSRSKSQLVCGSKSRKKKRVIGHLISIPNKE